VNRPTASSLPSSAMTASGTSPAYVSRQLATCTRASPGASDARASRTNPPDTGQLISCAGFASALTSRAAPVEAEVASAAYTCRAALTGRCLDAGR
jgi:hypothetical protein